MLNRLTGIFFSDMLKYEVVKIRREKGTWKDLTDN